MLVSVWLFKLSLMFVIRAGACPSVAPFVFKRQMFSNQFKTSFIKLFFAASLTGWGSGIS